MATSEPTVVIVDDDDDMRRSMVRMITSAGRKVDAYGSPADFLATFRPEECSCLIFDLRMPTMSGLQLFQRLRKSYGYVAPVIFVTGYGDIEGAVRAMRDGAWDFMEKPFSRNRLLDRMNEAIEFDSAMRGKLAERQAIEERIDALTAREREILELIMAGETTKDIAKQLDVSTKTVEGHRAHLFQKMEVNSVAQLSLTMAKLALLHDVATSD